MSYEATTNEAGVFTVQRIQPGPVKVTAALPGFKTFVREGVTLRTAETVTLGIQLSVGGLEETVTVSAQASAIESNESTIAQTIENKRIAELPLNGRQVYMLMQLTAGTIFTQTTFGATGFSGTRAWDVNGSLSVHGSRTSNNEFLIEGAPSSGTGGGTGSWNYAPPVDAIEEFKISTSSVDASFGRTSGGVVNMTLRSGTNDLRGSGIVLHRGTWLDSNQIQNIRNNISNKEHKYYNGEVTVSGPINRNRTFFMGGYQGFYENIPFPVTRTIPSEAQLRGDFSQTTTSNGTPILMYDPATTSCTADFSSCTRQPFSGNVIPEGRWSPIARALLPYIPRPNATPSNLAGSSNFISSPNIGRYRYNSYLTRIDHVFSDRHRLSVTNTGNWGIEYRNENALPEPAIRSDNYPTHRNHYLLTADDNYTINPSTLWNTRVSWDRFDEPHDKVFGNVDPQLPFQGAYQVTGPPFPQINIGGYEGMFPRTFRQPKNDAYSVNSNITKSMGRHFAKLGGEFRAYQFYRQDEVNSNGTFGFENDFTRRDPFSTTGATSGNSFATFLLGLPTSGNVTLGTPRTEQYRYYAVYLQDDWKLAAGTTINLGLRWDYQPAVTVQDDLTVSGFDFNVVNPLQSQLPQGANTINPATGQPLTLEGGLLFANRGGPKSPYKNDWNNIQPRIGIAQRVTDWLSARANYGRAYLGLSSGGQVGVYTTDFQRSTPFIAKAPNNVDPGTPWATPFPSGFLEPLAGELELLTALGTGPTVPNPDFEVPYTDQWMAGVDVQLPYNIGLDVAYVGNKVSKLGGDPQHQPRPPVGERQGHSQPGRQHGVSEPDIPQPVRRPGAGPGAQRGDDITREPAAAVPSLRRRAADEPTEPRLGVLQRARSRRDEALLERGDVRRELHADEAGGRDQLLHRLRYGAVSRSAGRSAASPADDHGARRPAVRARQADRRRHARLRRGIDRRLAVQHHWRDPVRPPAWLQRRRHPARPGCGAAEERAVVRALVRQQQHRAQQPAPRRLVRLERPRSERLPRRQVALPRRQRADRAAVGVLAVQEHRHRRREHAADSRRDVQRLQREDLRRTEHGSAIGKLRDRGYREPGQLPAHHPDRSRFAILNRAGDRWFMQSDGLRHAAAASRSSILPVTRTSGAVWVMDNVDH